MTNEVTIKSRMAEFRDALQAGVDGITKAGEIYVAALDEDPRNADRFRDEFAEFVPPSAWSNFEAVGRKWLHPRLIMGGVGDRKKNAIIKKMPYSMQERIFKRERFGLLTAAGETLQIDVLEATSEQAEQLCNGQAVRSISEQRAWIDARRAETANPDPIEVLPYTISDGKVTFRRGVTLSRAELKRLLTEM